MIIYRDRFWCVSLCLGNACFVIINVNAIVITKCTCHSLLIVLSFWMSDSLLMMRRSSRTLSCLLRKLR